jgi:acetyl-CoA synthetase
MGAALRIAMDPSTPGDESEAGRFKRGHGGDGMSNIGSYESRLPGFNWSVAEKELGYPENGIHNIAYYCVDRHCAQGRGAKLAMIWEGHTGEVKRFTFDDLKIHTNAFATFLRELGIEPGERICLFMDKIPELYISFLGGL